MKKNLLLLIPPVGQELRGENPAAWLIAGGILAFLILCYLVYALVKPEKL